MPATFAERLSSLLPAQHLLRGVPLRDYTTLRVGGPADYWAEISEESQVPSLLSLASAQGVPCLLLGNGSNLLVADAGFDGLVLHFGGAFSAISIQGQCLYAQAGASLSALARAAAERALTGLEFAAGIPGTVGGGVYMNCGAYDGEMKDVVASAAVLENGEITSLSGEALGFGYRASAMMARGLPVLSAVFLLRAGDREAISDKMRDLNARRRDKQPLQFPSAGSFFKRPAGHYAGALIQEAGLKGFAIGGAQVSEKHAGFLINTGSATADDFYRLMRHVQAAVFAHSGVRLEPEVRMIGAFAP